MRDYARILGKITESVWLITPSALAQIVDIVDKRIENGKLSDEGLEVSLADMGVRTNDDGSPVASNGIGVLSLYGPIFGKANLMTQMSGATSLETFQADLKEMLSNDLIHSIVMNIDSPGGTSDGVAETGALIRDGRQIKPIYALADSQAGSAAYWLASQASEVFATPSGAVGSVGAYTVHKDQSVSDAQQGHKYTFISAGEYKTEGNPHEPLSKEGEAYRQEVVNEIYDDFVTAVAEGRNVNKENVVNNFGGGRMLTAKKALEAGMIDGITTQDALTQTLARNQAAPSSYNQWVRDTSAFNAANVKTRLQLDGRELANSVHGALLEHKEMEHSEPGTGAPPAPRTTDDGTDDKAIKGGWRRDTPPTPGFPPDTVHPDDPQVNSSEGGEMETEVLLEQLSELYGVEDLDALVENIRADHAEAVALRGAVGSADEETRLAKEFPQMWGKLQQLENRDMEYRASEFVSSVEYLTTPDGEDGFKPTNIALTALAQDELREAYMKFAKGIGTLADFESAIQMIVNGGTFEAGEVGSGREPNVPTDLDSNDGVKYVQKQFAEKIAEVKTELGTDDMVVVIKEASKKYPELAAAYKAAVPR